MRIGKRIVSIIMVVCITVTMLLVDTPLLTAATEAEEAENPNADGTLVLSGDETTITISEVTIASTYYSAYGKCPIYVEYTTAETLTSEQRSYLELKVTKEDGIVNVCTQKSDISHNSFSIPECINIVNGDTYNLIFSIIYNKPGEYKELWSETHTVSFEDKDAWASCNYFPTGEKYYSFELYIPEDAITSSSMPDEVYLFDKDGDIAAKSIRVMYITEISFTSGSEDPRYKGVFSRTPCFIEDMNMWHVMCSFYRTRRLEPDEELYVAYSVNGEIYELENVMLHVTDKPYITYTSYFPENNYDYMDIGTSDIYAGIENANVIDVSAYNIDFSKLSIELQDKDTKETAGSSVNYMQLGNGYALYCIQWEYGKQPKGLSSYDVIYSYAGSSTGCVTDGAALSCYTTNKSENIMWNPMEDSIEYYNKDMLACSMVSYELKDGSSSTASSYASGECLVNNSHLITVQLNETPVINGNCYLNVTYMDSEGNEKTANPRSIWVNNNKEAARIYSSYLTKQSYLTNNGNIELSVMLYCKDKSKLVNICNASISKNGVSSNNLITELVLKNENGRLVYRGTCEGLDAGEYSLTFEPDGENKLFFTFYIEDSNRLCIRRQSNNIGSGKISVYFSSTEIADWYCGEGNSKIQDNLKIKILDEEENEIGTYKQEDFIVTGEDFYRDIQFREDIAEGLADINYCYVYMYYGDGREEDTVALSAYDAGRNSRQNFYDKELLYENGVYVKGDKENEWLWPGISNSNIWTNGGYMTGGYSMYGKCNSIHGTKHAFPAVITITDWYSLEVLKEITVNEPGHIFTETELSGLSPTRLYSCYIQGADGSVEEYPCYFGEYDIVPDDAKEEENNPDTDTGDNKNEENNDGGEDGKKDEEDKTDKEEVDIGNNNPETKPTKAPNVWYEWTGNSEATAVPEVTAQPEEIPEPTQTPEPSLSPIPMATIKPEVTVTPENTTVPEPPAQPEASAPPLDNKEPGKTDIIKWDTTNPTEKWELVLKKKKIILKKGQKAKIRITSKLNTKVVYKSLKPSVAIVNKNGIITAKKAGKATITVKANGKVRKVIVTVKKSLNKTVKIPAGASIVKLDKNFKLAKTDIVIKRGKKLVIHKSDGLSGKITFTSLDKKIASVSVNGVIKAKNKGKTTILIKKGKKTIKLKITVKK